MDNISKSMIIIHADDFGACEEVTENIMDVYRNANLTSVSVLVNGLDFKRSMQVLKGNPKLKYSIHFNITEGACVSGKGNVPLLVNEKGMFNRSFFSILMKSYLPGAKALKNQIKKELDAQLKMLLEVEDELGMARYSKDKVKHRLIRIDSHQHFHMIPVVLKCILEICDDAKLEIEWLRIPAEPLGPIFRKPSFLMSYRPINFIKNRVLAVLSVMNRKRLKPFIKDKSAVFFGMIMSCEMDTKRASELLPFFVKNAKNKGRILEVLAHPGQCTDEKALMDADNELCKEFYMSGKRMVEKDFLMKLKV